MAKLKNYKIEDRTLKAIFITDDGVDFPIHDNSIKWQLSDVENKDWFNKIIEHICKIVDNNC